jgi:hypothetical protein
MGLEPITFGSGGTGVALTQTTSTNCSKHSHRGIGLAFTAVASLATHERGYVTRIARLDRRELAQI